MKVAVVGGVRSTEVLIRALVKHEFDDCAVWGYVPIDAGLVSGWCDLRAVSSELVLPFFEFRKVTDCEESLRAYDPDVLFVVGLSQIIPESMLSIAGIVNVGFHPTALPKGRGRAAIAWMILEHVSGAASFFELRDGVDDGAILVQEPFEVGIQDDAASVEAKILKAESLALDRWLPCLAAGEVHGQEQDHSQATWLGKRAPDDGWLDWPHPRKHVLALIRASAPPHPGAYTYCSSEKILILSAHLCERPEKGVPGRIVAVHGDKSFEVACGDMLLTIDRWYCESGWFPKVGMKLGYYVENEIQQLKMKVGFLERKLKKN